MILMLITIIFFRSDTVVSSIFFNTNFLDLDAKSFQEITWLPS